MLDLEEINNTIEELENSRTTYENCLKLASLYIVRENINFKEKPNTDENKAVYNDVVKEYSDILPAYSDYCESKRKYQMNEIPAKKVLNEMENVCNEIVEFIKTLYSSSDIVEERQYLMKMISQLNNLY